MTVVCYFEFVAELSLALFLFSSRTSSPPPSPQTEYNKEVHVEEYLSIQMAFKLGDISWKYQVADKKKSE